ncbi:MAG: hypothetical protein M3Q56_05045 [Bacteroidota bacterium]|nr:hypothetical protein [Bacteroidota bacterium]
MAFSFLLLTILLSLFAILAILDGLYLHLIKFRLYEHAESKIEHLTHTIRAILFPGILYFFFLAENKTILQFGIILVVLDIVVLGIDAYMETDSRKFMGGLPRWEYILHLFVNGFHFASVAVLLLLKFKIEDMHLVYNSIIPTGSEYTNFVWLARNLIPGAIVIALIHIMVCFTNTAWIWTTILQKLSKFSSR